MSRSQPDIRHYKVPSGKLQTKDDVLKAFGYSMESKKKLGEGGFASVFVVDDLRKKKKVACKTIDLGSTSDKSSDDSKLADTRNELAVMEKVRHPHIIKMECYFSVEEKGQNQLFLFMEIADGGDLYKYIKKRGIPSETEGKKYFAQIVCGLAHMHGLGIAHRDVKCENVLLVANKRSISGDYFLRLSDFGLSKKAQLNKLTETNCGTPLYMGPELIMKKPYEPFLADVWALGISLFELLTLDMPFNYDKSNEELLADMQNEKWKWSKKLKQSPPSPPLDHLMHGMLQPDPTKRYKLVKVMAHEWVAPDYTKAHALSDQIKAEELKEASLKKDKSEKKDQKSQVAGQSKKQP